jgi:hypothetical protein
LRHTSRIEHGIVMNYNNAVARRMHVELDPLGAELDCAGKGRDRVFGERFVRPAVGDSERRPAW